MQLSLALAKRSPALSLLVAISAVLFSVCRAGAGPLDVAKAEYARYCRAITGGEPPPASFVTDASLDAVHDEYRIVSEGAGVRFVGAHARAVLYAVYDFLARRGGCRWFWDGDVVPVRASIDCSGLDIREKSQFEYRGIRYFAHRGLTRFQAEHWGPDDWRREIDWCVKSRLNVMMPRIGMDDLWQKAYPDVVPYPDPSKPLPEALKGFDNRTLFWPLEYRGRLRRQLTAYAEERGLIVPTDFGTMTHWYSRTPKAYLEKVKPDFLPQASADYSEDTGRVFDIRQPGVLDRYWKLTDASVAAGYGSSDVLHTIGLGERMVSTNRADNLKMKKAVLDRLISTATNRSDKVRVLLAGWDFYFKWTPEEVRDLIGRLDPSRTLVWDYEADAPRREWDWDRGGGWKVNNFTQWGLTGRFPYTFGIFLCYEAGLDVRADYALIEERQKAVENDPMCRGYLLWPESSHTDVLALRYFTENAWRTGGKTATALLPAFCLDRYGAQAAAFERLWRKVLPAAGIPGWMNNFGMDLVRWRARQPFEHCFVPLADMTPALASLDGVFADLAALDWTGDFVRRDAIDLARTAADRLGVAVRLKLVKAFSDWSEGRAPADEVLRLAETLAAHAEAFADLLELHTDYSLWESYERLDAVEKIRNPGFQHVLVDNAVNGYCRSHQYEAARFWYAPLARAVADAVAARVKAGDRKAADDAALERLSESLHAKMLTRPLREMRPVAPRTPARYRAVLERLDEIGASRPSGLAVDANVPSGNVIVDGIDGDVVRLRQDLRDSPDWFYWAFRVRGAEGRTLRFEFDPTHAGGGPVSARGAAVTSDGGVSWRYTEKESHSKRHFTYTFGPNEREVWFYQTFQYFPWQWDAFLARHATDRGTVFVTDTLCVSRKGRTVPKARFGCLTGKPTYRVFLSSRHHCGEATATYALEGLLERVFRKDGMGAWLRANVEFLVVPFVDYDGVVDGDQGKNRRPHDHNRDYDHFLYPETTALADWIRTHADNRIDVFLDMHCPWVRDGGNEKLAQVYGADARNTAAQIRWGQLLERLQRGALAYREADDVRWMTGWNCPANGAAGLSCTKWARKVLKGCRLVTTYEIPFHTANGRVVTPRACRDLGEDTADVLKAFLTEGPLPETSCGTRP